MGKDLSIGVILESFRLPFNEAVKKAAEVGAQGLQIYATQGEMAPENLTPALIAEKKRIIADNGLQIAALCGDIGGFMLEEDHKVFCHKYNHPRYQEEALIHEK